MADDHARPPGRPDGRVQPINDLLEFDLFWIVGCDAVARDRAASSGSDSAAKVAEQIEQVERQGPSLAARWRRPTE